LQQIDFTNAFEFISFDKEVFINAEVERQRRLDRADDSRRKTWNLLPRIVESWIQSHFFDRSPVDGNKSPCYGYAMLILHKLNEMEKGITERRKPNGQLAKSNVNNRKYFFTLDEYNEFFHEQFSHGDFVSV
jgi:hypothetical protein